MIHNQFKEIKKEIEQSEKAIFLSAGFCSEQVCVKLFFITLFISILKYWKKTETYKFNGLKDQKWMEPLKVNCFDFNPPVIGCCLLYFEN